MAAAGANVVGGVIDAGYRGELVLMVLSTHPIAVEIGERIAQLIPIKPETHHEVVEFNELSSTDRQAKGFGSSGK